MRAAAEVVRRRVNRKPGRDVCIGGTAAGGSELLDEYTIREFLHTGYPRLVAAVGVITGSRAVAEDAVQEALARAWVRSERGEDIRNLEAWATTVALNLARSGLRRLRVEHRARRDVVPTALDEPSPLRVDVERAVRTLPRRQREIVVLYYLLDHGVREIAETLGVAEGTVKTNLHRARAALAVTLRDPIEQEASDGGR